ncbi:MAG: ATP-binding protein, partial [Gammaproteobacteria bacterium]|nr:ATP-binding protein [Gammaproteobacteria bacterium]
FLTFASTVLLPSIILLLTSDQNPFHFTMGLLAIFYLIIISLAAHNYNRTLKDALNLRFENAELADNLFDERNKLVSEVEQRKNAQDELILAKQKAEAANSAKSRFLANMSHEIRTPLSSVIGYADILKNKEQPYEIQQQAIETISRSSHHLLNIISDILDLTKIESGKIDIESLPVVVHKLFDEIECTYQPLLAEKQIQLNINYQYPLPEVIDTDPTRFRQILFNLLNNAIKFTNTGSIDINIKYEAKNSKLMIEIKDTGIGMSQKSLETLFDAFVQADLSTTRRYGGSGLGLTISKKLSQLLGGDLDVESQENFGSTFKLSIFAGDNANHYTTHHFDTNIQSSSTDINNHLTGHVLLAEDGKDLQLLIKLFSEQLGLTITTVENGKEALDAVASQHFDLILMDIQMPVMDGLTAIRELRRQNCTTPILCLSANAMEDNRRQVIDAGGDDLLAKPFNAETFNKAISGFLSTDNSSDVAHHVFTKEEMETLVSVYKEMFTNHLRDIKEYYQTRQLAELLKVVHSLKGSGGSLGHAAVTDISKQLEALLKKEHYEEAKPLIQQLDDYFHDNIN